MATEQQVDQDRYQSEQHVPGRGKHGAPDGAELHPLIDLSRDPNPGVPNHAAQEED